MAVVTMMQGSASRIARGVVGLALIAVGLVLGGGWLVVAVVGLVPLAAGVVRVCLVAPLAHPLLRTVHGHRS